MESLPEKCHSFFVHLDRDLLAEKSQSELLENCDLLRDGCVEISSYADEYNFRDVRANGFWSFVRMVEKFDELLFHKLNKKHPKFNDLVLVSRALVTVLDTYKKLRSEMQEFEINNNNLEISPNLHAPDHLFATDGFTSMLQRKKELSAIICQVGPFWLCPSARKIFKMLAFGVALLQTPFPKSVFVMSHKKSRGMRYARSLTTGRVINLLDYADSPLYTKMYINFYHRKTVLKSKTKHLLVKNLYKIVAPGSLEKCDEDIVRKVRVRIVKDSEAELNKCLIFHVHGGCFMKATPDAHEIYLKDWVSQMKGTAVLAVDYTKDRGYPHGLQDILDVYLWLTNEEESVRKALGFVPKKIIFSGDSAGGNLSLGLTLILNDLLKADTGLTIKLPVGIMAIYGAFNLQPTMSAARVLAAIDPMLQQAVQLSVMAFYSGEEDQIDKHKSAKSKPNTLKSLWFHGSRNFLNSNFVRMRKALSHPYASPVLYEKFGELKSIPLSLLTTHFCPLLDDSVALARAWKGPVRLDMVDGLPHGFLNFIDRSKEAKQASDMCVKIIREMFNPKEPNDILSVRL